MARETNCVIPFAGGRGRWLPPMACVGTVPGWTAAGAGRAAPGVTASVSAITPAAAAAAAAAPAAGGGPGLTRLQGVKLWSNF